MSSHAYKSPSRSLWSIHTINLKFTGAYMDGDRNKRGEREREREREGERERERERERGGEGEIEREIY